LALGENRFRRRAGALFPGVESGAGAGLLAAALVFDEVDRGVGGAVADAVGERLPRLAETHRCCLSLIRRRLRPALSAGVWGVGEFCVIASFVFAAFA